MSEKHRKDYFENPENEQINSFDGQCLAEDDLLMEEILQNINTTPIGQVLKKIACLPEVRTEKVLNIRQRLTTGEYSLSDRLDMVLDRVLEDLTA